MGIGRDYPDDYAEDSRRRIEYGSRVRRSGKVLVAAYFNEVLEILLIGIRPQYQFPVVSCDDLYPPKTGVSSQARVAQIRSVSPAAIAGVR